MGDLLYENPFDQPFSIQRKAQGFPQMGIMQGVCMEIAMDPKNPRNRL
jgi:hypothetical protein